MKRLLREAELGCRKAVVAVGLATCVLLSAQVASADSLADNRDRLFEDYVARLAPGATAVTRCQIWRMLSLEQQGAFYTITHRLSISHLRDGASLLDHITRLYAIRGDVDNRACHGGDDNRLFMSMDNALRSAFTTLYLYPGGATFCDIYENNQGYTSWRDSGDWAGPHEPFTDSRETVGGYPTGQVHFFADYRATNGHVCRTGLSIIPGGCVDDPNLLEMDQDYDWNHPSSTECVYDNPLQGRNQRGRDMYDSNWGVWRGYGPLDAGWEPSACSAPPPPPPPSGAYIGCFSDDGNRALPQWLGSVGDVDACVNLARANGLAYAGLQWYGECFGGNQLGYTQVGDGECNTPCASGQMCGGAWRNSIYGTGSAPPPPPPVSTMQPDSAVRGCSNYSWWPPVYQPNAGSCYAYCAQNGANACEWYGNGDCYVEFGSGCYVQGGFAGWSAAVF